MKVTSEVLICYFREKGEEKGKFFFQADEDEKNLSSLIKFFQTQHDLDLLKKCIDRYVDTELESVITLARFVTRMGSLIKEVKTDIAAREEFIKLMKETKMRMDGETN